jgi:hypothetical protein
MTENNDLDVSELLESYEPPVSKDKNVALGDTQDSPVIVDAVKNREEIGHLKGRLQSWTNNCRDLFVDMAAIDYTCTADDSYLEFKDKSFYDKKLYFKIDPQAPKDPKVILATQQFCRVLGVPYPFFAANRPSLKMNIVKTWQAGLTGKEKKLQNILKIRESKDCAIIRAFLPITKCSIQLFELIDMILSTLEIPVTMEFAYGDEKDDLILHARFLFEKEYTICGTPVCLGFSLLASELDASPLIIDILVHDKVHTTSYIATYGGDPFFKTKYEGIQPKQIKEMFPKVLNRIDSEATDMIANIERRVLECAVDGPFDAESECMYLMRAKGFSEKIKTAVYHQITECSAEIKTPWDIAQHVGLVAKDFDSIKRLDIERGIGKYLQLIFAKE